MQRDLPAAPDTPTVVIAASLAFLALTLPWLNPVAGGPSTAVEPWLISMACALVVWVALAQLHAKGLWLSRGVPLIAAAWVVAAALSACIALLQYFDLARYLGAWVNVAPVGEAFGNLRQRNQMASLTNIGLVALLSWGRHGRSVWVLPLVVLLAVGNATTASRTGVMQLAGVAVLCLLWSGKDRRRCLLWVVVAVASYALATLALPWLLEVLAGRSSANALSRFGGEGGCSSRRVLWSNVLHLIGQSPWVGWGWGHLDSAHFMTLYPGERFCDILDNAHNLPLHLAVEAGVPFALLVGACVVLWVLRRRPWAERDAMRQMAWSVLAVIALHSLLEYPLWYGPFQIALVLCVVLLWRPPQASQAPSASVRRTGSSALSVWVALPLGAVLMYAAWDYQRISQVYLAPPERLAMFRENTLEQASRSWLFRDQVRFAELTITPLTRENAEWTFREASELLHFSPEPRVVEKLIESAVMTGREDLATALLLRFQRAFPEDHARWKARVQGDASAPQAGYGR